MELSGTDYDALESSITMTASRSPATPKVRVMKSVFMAPEDQETSRDVQLLQGISGVQHRQPGITCRDVSETMTFHKTCIPALRSGRIQTITITDKFIVEYPWRLPISSLPDLPGDVLVRIVDIGRVPKRCRSR